MRKTLFTVIPLLLGAILNAQTVIELDFKLPQDATYYFFRMTLPDIKQYEVMVSQGFSPLLAEEIQKNL